MTIGLTPVGSGLDHPECVCWEPSGSLVMGTESGWVHWLDPRSGSITRTMQVSDGYVAGVTLDGRGRVYACDVAGRRVVRADPATGVVETYSTGPAERPFVTPNYPVFDSAGRLHVSDSGEWAANDGRLVAIDPDRTTRVTSAEPASFTNGLAISPDGSFLYVVETSLPGISRLPLRPDGTLGQRELVVEMPRTVPDGLAFVDDGRLLISCYRPDIVYVWDGHRLETLVEDWMGMRLNQPTNLAFGGPDLDTLYAASLGGWHLTRIEAGLRGARLHYPDLA